MLFGPGLWQMIAASVVFVVGCSAVAGTCLVPCLWREDGYLHRRRARRLG